MRCQDAFLYIRQKVKKTEGGERPRCFAVEKLLPQDLHIQNGERPRTWDDVLRAVREEWCWKPPETRIRLISGSAMCGLISYAPTVRTVFAALLRRRLVYLCWGVPARGTWRVVRLVRLFRLLVIWWGAKALLVNDEVTREEITRRVKRVVYTVPFPVDPLFFQFVKAERTRGMIVVVGDNDRDEELIVELARSGWRIVRVTRAESVLAYYERLRSEVSVEVKFRAPYGELRELYQRAEVVAMPLKGENHAAGQTAVLEAVVSGAPVVLSAGRTASIVKDLESVVVCDTNEVSAWCGALRRAAELHSEGGQVLERSARQVAEQHSPEAVGRALIAVLDKVWPGTVGK